MNRNEPPADEKRDNLLTRMHAQLGSLMPSFEIEHKAELVLAINALKRERKAIVLGHNYMEPALFHFVADVTGDSLELCRKAAASTAGVIVFLGVEFMAETAKILNPAKTVLLPVQKAGCSLASSITAADVRELRRRYPGVPVVTYINTYADVKAETDICCTSANAARIVGSLGDGPVIFLPDEYLARNVARETGRRVIFPVKGEPAPYAVGPDELEKSYIAWHGTCEVHERFTVADISGARAQYPDVKVLAHPECHPDVTAAADFSGSTSAMIQYVNRLKGGRILLMTECAMADNIIAAAPQCEVVRLCSLRCPHMALITLEQTLEALTHMRYEIHVPQPIASRAVRAIDRMLEIV